MIKSEIVVKRLIDVIGAIVGLALFWPVIVIFASVIQYNSKGSIFYKQKRVGLHGREFYIYKLRTMYRDGDQRLAKLLENDLSALNEYKKYHCLHNDPRVVGVWAELARKYSVDEIPQFFNVLIGNMSLVGPRPLSYDDFHNFISKEHQALRVTVKPGITGLWQVSRAGKHEVSHNMSDLDNKYIQKYTLAMDVKIIFKTFLVVFAGNGQF